MKMLQKKQNFFVVLVMGAVLAALFVTGYVQQVSAKTNNFGVEIRDISVVNPEQVSDKNNTPEISNQQNRNLDVSQGQLIAQGGVNYVTSQYPSKIFFLNSSTDGSGFFSVAHNLPQYNGSGGFWQIQGITVAVQHTNGNWHTLEFSNSVDNRFWWNNTVVQGIMRSPAFYNRSVRIVLLTVWRVG
ncbi:MAG: hypothetical protein VKL59_06880 [Nostocaceae cyanobacterium]|nr:hypothetical protein [Nostocaceae cyanobacterium]